MSQSPAPLPTPRKGLVGLIAAVAIVLGVVIWVPAMRWFFLLSIPIGGVVAVILYVWNKHKPVKVEDDRPLKLH
ncbi:MAG TPA: hypothetical protein VK473_16350 [Terriglobales bacterium]|nr:hypothetical protein [Terriglobales bacterium]